MSFINLNKTERRKLAVFFSCLAIAAFAWLFFALSNQYLYSMKTVVDYTNLPQNKAFHPLQSDTVTVQVEGTGWNLLFSKISLLPQTIKVNLRSLTQRNYITFTEQLKAINRNLPSTQKIVSVMPDTLYFDFSSRSVKKVPVSLLYKVDFKKGFGISDSIDISPQSITITGPLEDIRNIETWDTDTLRSTDVKTAITTRVVLQKPSNNITIYPSTVEIKIPVSEFTEKVFDIPVSILNNEDNLDVKLLPSKTKVTFLVSLKDFSAITREDFKAAVDLENWSARNYKQLPVVLTKVPPFCKILKVEPDMIDFIIE